MTENEGDPVWLSVTQPRPTPMLYACPTPIPPVCCSQGCCLAGGHGASTPFAFNKEPGSSLGRWTALSTWGISVPKNMPALVKNRCRKASSSTSAGLVSSVLALAKTPFMLNSYSWWELSLTSSKGRKLLVSFSKSCQMNKALQERLSGEHPDSSVSPQGTGFGLLFPWLPVFSQRWCCQTQCSKVQGTRYRPWPSYNSTMLTLLSKIQLFNLFLLAS